MVLNHQCLYLVGIPGSGKSTLLAAALKGLIAVPVAQPFAHTVYTGGRGIQLGARRFTFSGTDALSLSVQTKAVKWLTDPYFPYAAVVAEGDRLGNAKFFQALKDAGWELTVVLLSTPPELAAQRCAARGSNQNATWLAGRHTKIKNLIDAGWVDIWADGRKPVHELVAELQQLPVIQQIRNVALQIGG